MWLDQNLVLCEDTEFFGAAVSGTLLGDVIDLGQFDTGKPRLSDGSPAPNNIASHPNFGGVMPMTLLFRITQTMAGGTSVNFNLHSSGVLNGSDIDGSDSVRHWISGVIPLANALAGREIIAPIPWDSATPFKRYLQIDVDRVGSSQTGKCSAMLLVGAHQWEALLGNYVQV